MARYTSRLLCRLCLSVSETQGSEWLNYALVQGSFALHFLLVDADTNSFISNPVGLDCGAMSTCARIVRAVDRPLNRELGLVDVGDLAAHRLRSFVWTRQCRFADRMSRII